MDPNFQNSPFHRFQGYRLLGLILVTLAYSYWFTVVGPYSKLASLAAGMPLEEAMHYSGAHAVDVLGQLSAEGRKAKYISLTLDVPNMVLLTLTLEGLIAFGLRRLNLRNARWSFLFILPLAFLLFDFLEDSFLALTLATASESLGTIAGLMTPAKMFTVTIASLAGLGLGIAGLIAWLSGKGRPKE